MNFRRAFTSTEKTVLKCTLSTAMWSAGAVLCALGAGELLQKHGRFVVSF